MTVPGVMDMQYVYSATQNNGRITQSIDTVTGEQVTYQYDQLNRLMRAETADNAWGELYTYDGFGNLTAKTPTKGSAPALQVTFDPQTNRLYGPSYDANGNAGGSFDVENRLTGEPVGYGFRMAYDPWGKRIFRRDLRPTWSGSVDSPPGPWEFYFYGITGQKLVTIHCEFEVEGSNTPTCRLNENLYFGSKMIKGNGTTITDRLGSVRADGTGQRLAYFPYGEDRVDTANGREKFGTYTRDGAGSASGLYSNYDYADQRYYDSIKGRFLSPDPLGLKVVDPTNPMTWNRYAYAHGDPVNKFDPTGTYPCGAVFSDTSVTVYECPDTRSTGGSAGDYNAMETVNSGALETGGGSIWSGPIVSLHPASNWNDALAHLDEGRGRVINMDFSQPCEQALKEVGVTPAQMVQAAAAAQFNNAMTSTESRAGLYSNTAAAGTAAEQYHGQNIQQWFESDRGVMAAADLNGFRIFFRPSGVDSRDLLFNSSLLMHELIHNMTGLDDDSIMSKMGLYGKTSDWITTSIFINCF